MNKERLLHAAKVVRNSPNPDKFYMDTYTHFCGSPGCVLGHLAHAGGTPLSLSKYGGLLWDGSYVNFDSKQVLEYFDINGIQAYELFSSEGCDEAETPEEAADFIEEFVRIREWQEIKESNY